VLSEPNLERDLGLMRYFPLFMDLANKPVLVIGGGEVASRKVEALVKTKANVLIVSPVLSSYLHSLVTQGICNWQNAFYDESQLDLLPFCQVWATTDDSELNHSIYHDAKRRHYFVNVVDDLPYCDFITPAMISRGRIQVAISSGGASPVLIRNMRKTFETILPQNLGLLAEFGAKKRKEIKLTLDTVELRRKFWEVFFDDSRVKQATHMDELDNLYDDMIHRQTVSSLEEHWVLIEKNVELLSIKALNCMQQAEIIFHSEHACQDYLELCRRDAEREQYKNKKELLELLDKYRLERRRIIVLIHPTLRYLYQQCGQGALLLLHGRIER